MLALEADSRLARIFRRDKRLKLAKGDPGTLDRELLASFYRRGLRDPALLAIALEASYVEHGDGLDPPQAPGYYVRTAERAAERASKAEARRTEIREEIPDPLLSAFPWTPIGAADRFLAVHGADILYDPIANAFYLWDGRHFASSNAPAGGSAGLSARVLDFLDVLLHLPATIDDPDVREAATKFVNRMHTTAGRDTLRSISADRCPVLESELDIDPMLLCAPNGMVNLETGDLTPHSHRYRATMMTAAPYGPDAISGLWHGLLEAALPDPDERLYFQKCVGYSLLGRQPEQRFFFAHGPGGTGKSTIIKAFCGAVGSYHHGAAFTTFLSGPGGGRSAGGAAPDLARLSRVRVVSSLEANNGATLDAGLVKQVTGGDLLVARPLFASEQEFTPRFALWFCANDRPYARAEDDAFWRRLVPFRFAQAVGEDDIDSTLGDRLEKPEQRTAILAWAVAGAVAYAYDGHLKAPPSISAGVTAYQEHVNPLTTFIEDELQESANGLKLEAPKAWERYQQWAVEEKLRKPLGRNRFHQQLCVALKGQENVKPNRRTYDGWSLRVPGF